ncbi:GTP-binding protein Era [hydrothermal vent metagenome]|uniref:GTP-binding protein Era n=1 Tax=hydrothermal vent metagenome TaxID=652676 RepID=A0A3B1C782_9ZZZZ
MGKSGFVTLCGRPNVGKSTLVNRLVGSKVAITSPRPQTTRNRIIGVMTKPEVQIVFIDTPGIMKEKSQLNKRMVEASTEAGAGCDFAFFMTDADRQDIEADRYALKRLGKLKAPCFLVINKIDLVKKVQLLKLIEQLTSLADFAEVFPISAKTGENVDSLVRCVEERMPDGPMFYPSDMITDQPEKFFIGEIVREKAFLFLSQELPYSTAVMVERLVDRNNGVTAISAVIYVERKSQKGIVIGKGGAMLKKIGSSARIELEKILGVKVFLELHVTIKEKWTGNERSLSDLGYRRE